MAVAVDAVDKNLLIEIRSPTFSNEGGISLSITLVHIHYKQFSPDLPLFLLSVPKITLTKRITIVTS